MLIGISYRSAIKCPECSQQVPVNHLRSTMLCSDCQATTDLLQRGNAWWTEPMTGDFATRMVLKRPVDDKFAALAWLFWIFSLIVLVALTRRPGSRGRALLAACLLAVASGALAGCPVQQRRKQDLDQYCNDPRRPAAYELKGNVWEHCVRLDGRGEDLYCCAGKR